MAKLIREIMFYKGPPPDGFTSDEAMVLNFELMDLLGDLTVGSPAYMARAKQFHDEMRRLPRGERTYRCTA
jgi:hypothetical protein